MDQSIGAEECPTNIRSICLMGASSGKRREIFCVLPSVKLVITFAHVNERLARLIRDTFSSLQAVLEEMKIDLLNHPSVL